MKKYDACESPRRRLGGVFPKFTSEPPLQNSVVPERWKTMPNRVLEDRPDDMASYPDIFHRIIRKTNKMDPILFSVDPIDKPLIHTDSFATSPGRSAGSSSGDPLVKRVAPAVSRLKRDATVASYGTKDRRATAPEAHDASSPLQPYPKTDNRCRLMVVTAPMNERKDIRLPTQRGRRQKNSNLVQRVIHYQRRVIASGSHAHDEEDPSGISSTSFPVLDISVPSLSTSTRKS